MLYLYVRVWVLCGQEVLLQELAAGISELWGPVVTDTGFNLWQYLVQAIEKLGLADHFQLDHLDHVDYTALAYFYLGLAYLPLDGYIQYIQVYAICVWPECLPDLLVGEHLLQ